MPAWLEAILEIIKLTIPALIVFFTVRTLLREYLDRQLAIKQLDLKEDQADSLLPMRVQAYERLSLLCERIAIPNLILRIRNNEMTNADLRTALLIAIRQEYEHNVAQQIYVSDTLWSIIQFARDEAVRAITGIAETLQPDENGMLLAEALFKYIDESEVNVSAKAQDAIRRELHTLF